MNPLNANSSQYIHHHATIKAFMLVLCELPLWLLVSMEVCKFDQYHRYLSSVSLRLQMVYPNIWILRFTRQMDLELMISSIISLRMANWNKWTKLFTDLLVLFIGFICLLVLYIGFGGFIYWIYLLALVLAYTVSILIAISFRFSQRPERNIFTFLSLYISQVLMEKIFRFPLRHHSCFTKLPLLQLYHCPSLIKLTNITSLHHNHNTCSILTLHHSNITSHYLVFIHLQFHSDFQLPHLPSTFVSLARRYVHILSPTTYGMLRNYYFFPATSKLIQDWDQSMKTQFSAPYAPKKLTKEFSKIWHWPAPTKTAIHDVIKHVMVYLSAKLVMQKILAALSTGNVLSKALESPKLLSNLGQFMNFQIVPLLLENPAPFAEVLSALMPI